MATHLLSVEHVSKNFGATKALHDVSFTIDRGTIHSLLGRNGAGKSTVVNIIAGIHQQSSGTVLLDGKDISPYSVFERQELFVFVNELKAKGTAFIFISHYLQEVVELSDEVTVIRDGMAFSGGENHDFQEERLAHLIAGEEVKLSKRLTVPGKAKVALSCKNVSGPILNNVSVDLYEGEITGVVGFPSSGARELCRAIFGLEEIHSGSIEVNGHKTTSTATPAEAMANGIAYLSYDRHKEGIVGLMPIASNISLPIMYTKLKTPAGLLNKKKSIEIAEYYFKLLNIKANSIYDKLASLSGGNQQKVVYAKTLSSEPNVLMLDEPTIGIDIKSREEIMVNIDKIATERKTSVVYLTNDFDELIRIVDRMLFFQDGRLMRDVKNLNLTHEDVIRIRDEVKEQARKEAMHPAAQ